MQIKSVNNYHMNIIDILKNNIFFENIEIYSFTRLDKKDMIEVLNMRNHENVRKWMNTNHLISIEEHNTFLHALNSDIKNFYFLVKVEGSTYGVFSLNRLDFKNLNSYIGIYSNPENISKNKGSITMRALLYVAFSIIRLHTLKLEVVETNNRAISFYTKFGFFQEGLLMEFLFKEGKWFHMRVMGLINKADRVNYD